MPGFTVRSQDARNRALRVGFLRNEHESLQRYARALADPAGRPMKDHLDLIELRKSWRRWEWKFQRLGNRRRTIRIQIWNRNHGLHSETFRPNPRRLPVD